MSQYENRYEFGYWLNKEQYPNCVAPQKAHESDAGFDLFFSVDTNNESKPIILAPGERGIATTGIHLQLDYGWEAQIRPRSGNAIKKGLTVLNSPGTVDCSYLGEVMVILYNASDDTIIINEGDKIAQMVIKKVPNVTLKELSEKPTNNGQRGENGFGSTGN